mgnify:CR=1 FL=1
MRIQFIYPESGYNKYNNLTLINGRYYHGIGQLSAFLKQNGHDTGLIHIVNEIDIKKVESDIRKYDPDIICLSSTTHMLSEIILINDLLEKEFSDKTRIIGGIAISIEPELIDRLKGFDYAVIGDGEIALIEIIENLKRSSDKKISDISNVIKRGQKKERINVRCHKELDELPFGDRDIFDFENTDDYKLFKRLPMMTSRGCRFSCSFCSNSVLRKYYFKDTYLRFRSPKDVCDEIAYCIQKYPEIRSIQFQSDLFFDNKEWLDDFVKEYKRIALPYHCLMRVEQVDKDVVKLLKESGCEQVLMGIESGSESTRKSIGKTPKTKIIFKAFELLKRNGIKTGSFNMMGFLKETTEDIFKGIYLNAILKPDLIQVSIYYPYKNTLLYDQVKDMLYNKHYHTYFERSLMKEKYLVKNFYYFYKNYEYLMRFINEKKDSRLFWLWELLIKNSLVSEKILRRNKPETFRILF